MPCRILKRKSKHLDQRDHLGKGIHSLINQYMDALSFWTIQIVLEGYKLNWSGANCFDPNHFGLVQIRLFWTIFYNLDLSKRIWM